MQSAIFAELEGLHDDEAVENPTEKIPRRSKFFFCICVRLGSIALLRL